VVGLIERDGDLAAKLRLVPTDVDLAGASDADLDVLFAVQRDLDNIAKIGHVIRSKLLAHKRPRLVPIRDQYVLMALLDGSIIETPLWKGRYRRFFMPTECPSSGTMRAERDTNHPRAAVAVIRRSLSIVSSSRCRQEVSAGLPIRGPRGIPLCEFSAPAGLSQKCR
jgi:hypothetical protein